MEFPIPFIQPWQGDSPGACHPHFYGAPAESVISWPDEVEGRSEVAVVGAGLSGLTAAFHLRHREVTVWEAGDEPGGVCRPGSYRQIAYPAGSAYFYYPWNEAWHAWYRELGLPVHEALISEPMSALLYEGNWFPDCFSEAGLRRLPLPQAVLDGLAGFAADLGAWDEVWEPLGTESFPQPELDRISLTHYLEVVRGLPPEVTRILTPYCRSCLGAGPESISAWAGVFFLMSEFAPGARAAAFPQGNARIIQALVAALPRPPLLHQTVTRLEPKGDAVHLLVWDGPGKRPYRWEAGVVILALGKFAARHLLSPACGWEQKDFTAFCYSSYLVAALCGAITLEAPGYENWVVGEEAFSDFILSPRQGRPGEPRALVAFAPQPYPGGRQPLLSARPEEKAREVLGSLARLFPGLAPEVAEVHLYRFGHAQVIPYPGFLTFLRGLPAQQGRIILSHSDQEGLSCVEAAIVQGQKAARRAEKTLAG